ncbi:hypothetical protein CPLU01_05415 [Colletotrichum plurivorum]|uniref:Uncharacterized protein n=1 Tax=Colletotrichum plurivorum TaxID=2175906 RepID=A0A8H6KLD0_9PEZI|nr:hypothetical protein CPLU01_05415 [Colletotrichum plurivorum]
MAPTRIRDGGKGSEPVEEARRSRALARTRTSGSRFEIRRASLPAAYASDSTRGPKKRERNTQQSIDASLDRNKSAMPSTWRGDAV